MTMWCMWIVSNPHCWSDHGEYVVVVAIILLVWWWTTTTIHPCMPIIYHQQHQQQQHPRHHHCNTPIDEPLAWPWRVDIGPTGFTERSYSSSLPRPWKQVSPPGGSMTFKSCARGDQIYEIRSSGHYHHHYHHPSQTTMMLLLLLLRRRIIIIIFIQRHIHSP